MLWEQQVWGTRLETWGRWQGAEEQILKENAVRPFHRLKRKFLAKAPRMRGLAGQEPRREHWLVEGKFMKTGGVFLPFLLPVEELFWAEASRHLERDVVSQESQTICLTKEENLLSASAPLRLGSQRPLPWQSNSTRVGCQKPWVFCFPGNRKIAFPKSTGGHRSWEP